MYISLLHCVLSVISHPNQEQMLRTKGHTKCAQCGKTAFKDGKIDRLGNRAQQVQFVLTGLGGATMLVLDGALPTVFAR
jgi:hypothetical protein